ncbi:hypothetical protein KRX51_07255 [Corynebacterium sp. TAE3-ERU12]|uniref:LGFP repeat-containing protein n=1 Tax=Corynebacterium sp. TAE3-ERU12 TaxID=2849491 RepID=UPI001C4840F6|nr:hypothetical protein [Corynebacterium sp. TAE3-ERU12]MBV7295709.1 hypothetical protein [Corynebacterium sp. TAE3-ERU12]
MRSTISRSVAAAVLGTGLVFGAAACSTDDAEDAVVDATNAVEDAAGDAKDAADKAGDKIEEGAEKAKDAVDGEIDGKEVSREIQAAYEEFGGADELGTLEEVTEENGATVAIFSDNARIYETEEHGAILVQGKILDTWMENGGPEGELGMPIEDEEEIDNGWISYFEGGSIKWTSEDGQNYTPTIEMGDTPDA